MQPFTQKRANGDVFLWNIEFSVGIASPNKKEDVELVQLGYFAASKNPLFLPALRPVFEAVVPGAIYTGSPNDPLTLAILAQQKARGGTQDGHVSPIKGTTYDGKHSWMLNTLINTIFDLAPNDYPRIDRIPQCPPALRAAVAKCFTL